MEFWDQLRFLGEADSTIVRKKVQAGAGENFNRRNSSTSVCHIKLQSQTIEIFIFIPTASFWHLAIPLPMDGRSPAD